MAAEHANQLCSVGSIQIGTLFGFRDSEIEGVSDPGEGSMVRTLTISEQIVLTADESIDGPVERAIRSRRQLVVKDQARVVFDPGVTVTVNSSTPDMYTLCCSTEYSKRVLDSFPDSHYDAVVEISDFLPFLAALSSCLFANNLIRESKVGSEMLPVCCASIVVYEDRVRYLERWFGGERIEFVKPECYRDQAEIRGTWQATTAADLSKQVIRCPAVIPFCRILPIPR